MQRWLNSSRNYGKPGVRIVCYLSAEFLLGPHLGRNMLNLGIEEPVKQAVKESGLDIDDLMAQEEEPGLGNGGLGRLAACYMESLASLEIPAMGYGIRYEFGIFDQEIRDGWQVEITDKWLQYGNPWEIPRPDYAVTIGFGGRTESYTDNDGRYRVRWVPGKEVQGIPYDTPIPGYKVNTINTLAPVEGGSGGILRTSSPSTWGDYYGAVDSKVISENISKVLYPNDEQIQGKQLRLEQQFFFVSCALQDMIRTHLASGSKLNTFHEKFTAQLNDTHPAVGVAELMRLLVDIHGMGWAEAWEVTQKTFAFTNHTLLPEALEKWPIDLFGRLLPRHLEIIFEINQRFMDKVRIQYLNDPAKLSALSLIDESSGRYVRMANLACVGSYAINGVAALHTELLKQTTLKDFDELYPGKITNVTNGVTPRRWIALSNPRLAALYTEKNRRRLAPQPGRPAPTGRLCRRPRLPPLLATDQAGGEGPPGRLHPRQNRHRGQPRLHVRRAGEAHPRVQAPASDGAAHHHPVRAAEAEPKYGCDAPHLHLRRQGSPRLPHGQADD